MASLFSESFPFNRCFPHCHGPIPSNAVPLSTLFSSQLELNLTSFHFWRRPARKYFLTTVLYAQVSSSFWKSLLAIVSYEPFLINISCLTSCRPHLHLEINLLSLCSLLASKFSSSPYFLCLPLPSLPPSLPPPPTSSFPTSPKIERPYPKKN